MGVLSSAGGLLLGRHIACETGRQMVLLGLMSLSCSIFGSKRGAWGNFSGAEGHSATETGHYANNDELTSS